ncbi:hypothetical protein SBF1_3770005 [Candidatus Desulfosporosinus infrequens]|uniref:Uncharacterized protein n=1 Tax=Candidatus Desulfosporosinus infrequens TaxID=2043169 RepID=A0A2U3L555_9FIRM|nr:hypothetical protein SBF1_3770005 [Candidatus Desulfosporosinus infrequens]
MLQQIAIIFGFYVVLVNSAIVDISGWLHRGTHILADRMIMRVK